MKLWLGLALCTGLSAANAHADVDTNRWYRLRNAHLGDGRSLDTYSDGNNDPFMSPTGNDSGQRWKITPIGGGQYRITNDFLGECRSLDTYSGDDNRVFMGESGNDSGQRWLAIPNTAGRYRFTNTFLGERRSLDTYSGTVNFPFMGKTGAFAGQRWSLTPLDAILPNGTIPMLDAPSTVELSEGPSDFSIYLRAEGTRRIGMVFVDFSDAPGGSASTAAVAKNILGDGAANSWLSQRSYGKFSIDVTRKDGWRRMPQPSTFYDFSTTATHLRFFADAAALFSDIDLSTFDVAWVVAAESDAPGMALSPALNVGVGQGARATTMVGEIRLGVSFGKDSYTNDFLNGVHELLHLHALPDLYTGKPYFTNVGAWDVMSDFSQSSGLLGWHRHKLGWLDAARKVFQSAGSRQHALTPLDGNCGTSMIVVPIDSSRVFAIEIAQPFKNKNGMHAPEGVLIYTVDATIATQMGPVVVQAKNDTNHPTLGPKANAPFSVGDTFRQRRLTVRVMNKMGPLYRVQVDIAP